MGKHYEALVERLNELDDLGKAGALMSWDREVNMPKGGMQERVAQMTTIAKLYHNMATSDAMGELIENANNELNGSADDSTPKRMLKEVNKAYQRQRVLPAAFVKRRSEVSGFAHEAWVKARADNDFDSFKPHLEQVVELCQELAGYYDNGSGIAYDALLDIYEPETKSADVQVLFDAVKDATVPLLQAIRERGKPTDTKMLFQPYDIAQQKKFATYIAKSVGYDFDRGHLGTVVHPFAISFSRNDSRITSRWYPEFLNPGVFGVLHESGHAMYEQGTSAEFSRTPLARGTSLGIHESQSRMIENIVGRSYGFWQAHYATAQEHFPAQLGGHSLDAFYRAINHVEPSLIRVEADELTYNFHIILRFELETAMLNGDLAVADLPAAWNAKMQELIGVTPPNNSDGCLQDVHWSGVSFGYFPTYALGNLYASQLYAAAIEQKPAIVDEMAVGKTETLVNWLVDNIHVHGKKYSPREIVQMATGKPLSHTAFVDYAVNKFSKIYEL